MKRVLSLLLALSLFTPCPAALADEEGSGADRSLAPRLWIPGGDPAVDNLPLKSTRADIRVDGPVARVTITQRYGNEAKRPLNARYLFPGSTRAAVHGLTMKVGERVVKAKIKEKEEAAKEFERAKQEGHRAALLDQERPNVFTMDVANIQPGDNIELTLEYTELLVPEEGIYELVYPTVVGPRYGGDPLQAPPESRWIANPYAANSAEGGNPAAPKTEIHVSLTSPLPVKQLESTQHKIATHWLNDKSADIDLDPGEKLAGNRDFILRFRLSDDRIVSGLTTFRQNGENWFLMMAQPPKRVASQQVLGREYLFIVDVSGSMHGFPLDTARVLMRDLLAGLKPQESFNILFFSGDSRILSDSPLPATPENVERAARMMGAVRGGGGTELLPALQRAFAMPRTPDVARSVVVVTDGYVAVERAATDLIRKNVNNTNLFAFGIGSSVNRHLLETMAQAGGGEPFVVTDATEAAVVGARFRRYVAAPLLSEIAVKGEGVELYDMEPAQIPGMLAERPVVVFGKYRGAANGAIVLTGKAADGPYTARMPLATADSHGRAELLPILWARHRLMRLSDFAGGEEAAHRDEIVQLGLKYSLLTQFTSFIAVDEEIAGHGAAKDVTQPLPLPQGVTELALGSPVPEPETFWMVALAAAAAALSARKRKSAHARG